jgi:hypothetical protein
MQTVLRPDGPPFGFVSAWPCPVKPFSNNNNNNNNNNNKKKMGNLQDIRLLRPPLLLMKVRYRLCTTSNAARAAVLCAPVRGPTCVQQLNNGSVDPVRIYVDFMPSPLI